MHDGFVVKKQVDTVLSAIIFLQGVLQNIS